MSAHAHRDSVLTHDVNLGYDGIKGTVLKLNGTRITNMGQFVKVAKAAVRGNTGRLLLVSHMLQ